LKQKILIIDDSPTERTFLESMLAKAGYQCITASSGEEGIEAAKAQQPDLILMDVVMPGLNGFQATRAITHEETTKHIPVIMCSAVAKKTFFHSHKELDRYHGASIPGPDGYIEKPPEAEELLSNLQRLVA